MTYRGHIKNGAVVLEDAPSLPEGAEVSVEVVTEDIRSLKQGLRKLSGVIEGGPADLARNHDHYLYGTPKK
ncbi:MAG TPA: hypothetical protein VIL86_00440 [Tepidisphaeraceae bacterium]